MNAGSDPVPQHVTESIATIAAVRHGAAGQVTRHQRLVEAVATKLGQPRTVYVAAVLVVTWIAYNASCRLWGWRALDPAPFFWLQGASSLFAALITTIVLASQNRQRRELEKRALLELQVNVLAEHKVTKIIALLEELRRDLPTVVNRTDSLADAMQEQANPSAMLSALEMTLQPAPETEAE
jgi:uncharacterized membrane protein